MVARGPIERLLAGFKSFHAAYYEQRPERIQPLVERGQAPEVLVIACSDSRIDPAILMNSEPGELFVVRNVANLVPPYNPDGSARGVSSAMEMAIRELKVRHVIVLGHSGCGGIRTLVETALGRAPEREFLTPWVRIAAEACAHVVRGDDAAAAAHEVEHRALLLSLRNLRTFPWIVEAERSGELDLRGWWFDLGGGALWEARPGADATFRRIWPAGGD
jgi:carbonic anhydrase